MTNLNQLELLNTIRLIRTENIGVRTFWRLLSLYKTSSKAIEHVTEISSRAGKNIVLTSKSTAEEEMATAKNANVKIIHHQQPEFPETLKNIEDCPPILFCLGNLSHLNRENVAIVGSRNASANGLRFAYQLSQDLSNEDKIIVSGFARGIDNAAHKASVNSTIAVLAGGIDHIYPPEYKDLYYELAEKSLIVSELPLGTIPKSQNFPQRNRIISGISKAVAVIESSLKSGSLITARMALEQNRELFVVPGFPLDPRYQGNNLLLKQGANLLESAKDILEFLNSKNIKSSCLFEKREDFLFQSKEDIQTEFSEKELTAARIEIINLIGSSPTSVDEIVSFTNFPIGLVLTIILELELSGKINRHYGNKLSIIVN